MEKFSKLLRKFTPAFNLSAKGVKALKQDYITSNGKRRHSIKQELKAYIRAKRIEDSPIKLATLKDVAIYT